MEKILGLIKKIVPKVVFNFLQPIYHYKLALLGALIYRFPSRKIKVVGVTGTKGKSSVVEILSATLEEAGFKVASQSTVRFKIGEKVERNLFKMTMPGRFFIQKFLRDAVSAKCDFAVIEITSEGVRQYRHKFIALDALIFTNLAPEHIESHGGYEKYLNAKLSIAGALGKSPKNPKFMVANTDDKEAAKFFEAAGCHLELREVRPPSSSSFEGGLTSLKIPYSLKNAEPWKTLDNSIEFTFDGQIITSPLRGKFNIYNALATAEGARAFGIRTEIIKKCLAKISEIPGRVESIKTNYGFEIIVDYAHTPDSLQALYETFYSRQSSRQAKKLICVLGNTGGGRDTWKRPRMGKIANEYCDEIILTNEDPYDEDPRQIVEEMATAIRPEKLTIEIDRRKAIDLAINKARNLSGKSDQQNNCVVLITGKGTDPYIMEANGKKTSWSDKKVAEEKLEKLDK